MKLPSAMSVINAFLPVVVTILIVSTIICGQTSGISTAVIGQNVTSINNASVVNSTIPVGLVQPVVPVVVTNVSTVALASVSSVVTIGPHAACYTSRHCLDSGTVCKVANLAQILAHRSESNIIKPNYAYLTAVRESIDLASSDLTQPYEEPEASLVSTTGVCQCDSRRRTACLLDIDCEAKLGSNDLRCVPSPLCGTSPNTGFCRLVSTKSIADATVVAVPVSSQSSLTAASVVVIPAILASNAVVVNESTSTTSTSTTVAAVVQPLSQNSSVLMVPIVVAIVPVSNVNNTAPALTVVATAPPTEEPTLTSDPKKAVLPVIISESAVPVIVSDISSAAVPKSAQVLMREPRVEVATVETATPAANAVILLPAAGWQPVIPGGIPNDVVDYHGRRRYNGSADSRQSSSILLASVFLLAYCLF